VPDRSRTTQQLLRFLPKTNISPVRGSAIGAACSLAAVLLRILIDPVVQGVPFVTFFPFLVVATLLGGIWGGATGLLLDVMIAAYAWVLSADSLNISRTGAITLIAFIVSGGFIVGVVYALNEVVDALRRSEHRSAVIAREMQHRVKNVLQLVQAVSSMTARNAVSAQDHQNQLNGRILALSRSLEAPNSASHLPVGLQELLTQLVAPFDAKHFVLAGPQVAIGDVALMLSLAVHELATNAAKYGALSVPGGSVSIRWRARAGFVDLVWEERGGPSVSPPNREGFGSTLIKGVFRNEGGLSSLVFNPTGVRCALTFPVPPGVAEEQ
jgi:two-component sensor histidine kinase